MAASPFFTVRGVVRRRRNSLPPDAGGLAGILGLLGLVAAVPVLTAYAGWAGEREMQRAWTIGGAACPEAVRRSPDLFGARPAKIFAYGGAVFARRFGHVSCAAPVEPRATGREVFHVCQFTSPGAETTVFLPGIGNPATVTLRDGRSTCVIGGWYRL